MSDSAQPPEESAPCEANENALPDAPFFHRIDWLSFGITAMIAFAIYLGTIALEVTLGDGGTFVTGAAYAGVPDCPGFPLWTIYSWLFVKLIPFSNIAWRLTVGSALAAALACGCTALMVSRGGVWMLENTPTFDPLTAMEQNLIRVVCGCAAGLALGLCEVIWSDVAKLNVWALSILLVAVMLALLMRWTATPHRRGFLHAAMFVFGLVLTNSQAWLAVAPAVVLCVILADREFGRDLFIVAAILATVELTTDLLPFFAYASHRNVPLLIAFVPAAIFALVAGAKTRRLGSEWKAALICGVLFKVNLGLYFYPALASMTNPPLNWGYPRTVEGLYHLVARAQYDSLYPTENFIRFIQQLGTFVQLVGRQFGWLYFIFIPVPVFRLRRAQPGFRQWMKGLTAVFVGAGPS